MSNISYFNKFPAKGQPHLASGQMTIDEFLSSIKFGKWKNQVELIRLETDKTIRNQMKSKLVAVTISGTFEQREEHQLIQHSGFLAIDIDGNTNKQLLINDPYVYALFSSVSGLGFVPIFRIDKSKHKESFNWIRAYLFNSYGLVVDPAPQNVASLRYVSFDQDLIINEKAKIAKFLIDKPKKPKNIPIILGNSEFSEIIKSATGRGINLCESYEEYRDIAFALANGMGENGRDYFHSLSSVSQKYDHVSCEKQFDIALRDRGSNKITIGTLYYYLKRNGIEIKSSNQQAITMATMAKKSNRTKDGVINSIVEMTGTTAQSATLLVDEVFNRSDINIESISKDPEKLIENICLFLAQNYSLQKNCITQIVENKGEPITKEMFNSMYIKARMLFNSTSVSFDLIERMVLSEMVEEYHPINKFIDDHRHLRSTGNLDKLIKCIETDTLNHDVFIKKWMIGIMAANSGVPVRYVLALCGGQHSGKTEWFRRLLPKELSKYYAESKLDAGKDDDILMCQKLIVMDDELGGKSKKDDKRFKELTSKNIFSLRVPYGRYNEDFKRLAILCGTSNEHSIINDPTGNTRYLPINVIKIDYEMYNSIDKTELFMEVFHMFEAGEAWQLTKEEFEKLTVVSSDFEIINLEGELLQYYFDLDHSHGKTEFMTATDIKDYIELFSKQKITNMKRFGTELKKMFGKSFMMRKNGGQGYFYQVKKVNL